MHLSLYNTHEDNYNVMISYSDHLHSEAPLWVSKHLKAVAVLQWAQQHTELGAEQENNILIQMSK